MAPLSESNIDLDALNKATLDHWEKVKDDYKYHVGWNMKPVKTSAFQIPLSWSQLDTKVKHFALLITKDGWKKRIDLTSANPPPILKMAMIHSLNCLYENVEKIPSVNTEVMTFQYTGKHKQLKTSNTILYRYVEVG
jgi:hypothetical protein